MRFFGLKTTAFCLIFALTLSMAAFADVSAQNTADTSYDEALEVLTGLNLVKTEAAQPYGSITRAEFAELLTKVLGWETLSAGETEVKTKFLGYTNNPEFDENGDWVWKDGSDGSDETTGYEHATPFKDVLTTNQYWNSIRLVASFGLMSGDENGYFRPNDEITFAEAQKVLVYACGSGEKTGGSFPTGVIREAARLGITDGFTDKSANESITYRDAIVLVYNSLDANVYEATSYKDKGVEYKKSKDETLLSYYTGIYRLEGVVTKNRFTSLSDTSGTDGNSICVDGITLRTADASFDYLLGYNVDAYYKDEKLSQGLTAVYVRDSGRGNEITVDSEEIIDFSANRLTYQKDGESKKSRYIGADTNIIYNGKALTDYTGYTDKILVPKQGSIKFVDADSNGDYETVFVNSIETVVVSAIDYDKKIIYNKMQEPKSVEIGNSDVFITDTDGMKYELSDITIGSVLDVERTLKTQGDMLVNIKRAFSAATGVVTSHSPSKKEITVGGKTYEYSKNFDVSLIELGPTITFYINTTGKIIWANKGSELNFAYLADISTDNFGKGGKVWLYDLSSEEFTEYALSDTVKVNKVNTNKAKVIDCSAIYDASADRVKAQLIKYRLNDSGNVCEILTANVDEDEFVEQDLGENKGKNLLYRNAAKVLTLKTPVVYINASSIYSSVPKTDCKNKDLYYEISMTDNNYYTVDRAYKNSSKSAVASVVLTESDVVLSNELKKKMSDDSVPLSMVMEIKYSRTEDGEDCVELSGMNGENGYFSLKSADADICEIASDLKPGDLIRYEVRKKDNTVSRLIKVFDADGKKWTKAQNPFASNVNAFNTRLHAVHGEIVRSFDDGAYITVAPYVYSSDSSGNVVKSEITADETLYYTYPATSFKIYKFDPDSEEVTIADALTELISAEEAGVGTEVVVYTNNSNPRSIFVFK